MKREDIKDGMKIVAVRDVYCDVTGNRVFDKGDIVQCLINLWTGSIFCPTVGLYIEAPDRGPVFPEIHRAQHFKPYIEPVKKMTVAEIEQRLGHKVEVVSDG